MMTLEDVIRPSQQGLFHQLKKLYAGNTVVCSGKFLLVKGKAPVLLVAHLDTVHREKVKMICQSEDGNILMSPQGIGGDDRCGVYALVKLYEQAGEKPWLLFTCDEETGAGGAKAFAQMYAEGKIPIELGNIKCIIELDRKGKQDAVYYDCGNEDFEQYISSKGFKTADGTFSDISLIAPAMEVAAVNLSAGYYHAHTRHEYINRSHLEAVIEKVGEIIRDASGKDFPRYEYIEQMYGYGLPKPVPKKYAELYEILLGCYYQDEIEGYRGIYGDEALLALYRYAFGKPYTSGNAGKGSGTDELDGLGSEISQTVFADDSHDGTGQTGHRGQLSEPAGAEPETNTMVPAVSL